MDVVAEKIDGLEPPAIRAGGELHLDGVSVEYPDWHFNVRPRTPSR